MKVLKYRKHQIIKSILVPIYSTVSMDKFLYRYLSICQHPFVINFISILKNFFHFQQTLFGLLFLGLVNIMQQCRLGL